MDSVIWKNIPFEKGAYRVGEYKKFKLTPTQAGSIEISSFGYDCELSSFTFPNAGLLKNATTSSTLLGAVAATVTTIVAVKPKIEKRSESAHTESLQLHVLP